MTSYINMVTSFLMRANQQDWFLLLLGTGLGISNLQVVKCPTVLQQQGKRSESAIITQTEAQGDRGAGGQRSRGAGGQKNRGTEGERDRGTGDLGTGGQRDRGAGGQDVLRPRHL